MILLEIQQEKKFLPTSKHREAEVVAFLVFVCMTSSFIAQISSSINFLKTRRHLSLGSQNIVNSQGYSELR